MKSSFDKKHNIVKAKPENKDDLYVLSDLITLGSKVRARTLRSVEVMRGEKKEKVGKRPMVLKIIVDKIELKESLRVGGKIIEGPEDITMSHHTINITPNTQLSIEKEWKGWEINKLKAAAIKTEPVLVCILDEKESDFYLVKDKIQHKGRFLAKGIRKEEGKTDKSYFGNIIAEIKRLEDQSKYLVIGGPGFARENLVKMLKNMDISQKIISESCSHTEKLGMQEILKRKVLEKVVKQSRISKEAEMVEKLLEEIAKEGKAVYGKKETKKAVEAGAVSLLLISDKLVRENEKLMELTEKNSGEVMIIDSSHDSGEKFFGLGGIGALLRYKIDFI